MKLTMAVALMAMFFSAFARSYDSKSYNDYLDYDNIEEENINLRDIVGETPLHRAAAAGDIEAMKDLITDGANVVSYDIDGQSPLYYAIASVELEAVYLLAQYGEHIYNEEDIFGRTAYDFAEEMLPNDALSNFQGAYEFSRTYRLKDGDFEKALSLALRNGDLESVRYLISCMGLDPYFVDQFQDSLLHNAVKSNNIELITYIAKLYSGKTPLFVNIVGQTPLHIAVENKFQEAISILINVNPDQLFVFSTMYATTSTPYMLAKNESTEEVESIILSALLKILDVPDKFRNERAGMAYDEIYEDSDKTHPGKLKDAIESGVEVAPYYYLYSGVNPATLYVRFNAFHLAARYKKLALIEAMAGYFEGDINQLTNHGYNLFTYLIEAGGDLASVKKLVELGATPSIGKNPIEQAIEKGDAELVGYLLKNGSTANQLGSKNNSMLMVAIKNNKLEIAESLLEESDLKHVNDDDDTSLDFAARFGSLPIFGFIAERSDSIDSKTTHIVAINAQIEIAAYLMENYEVLKGGFGTFRSALDNGMFDFAEFLHKSNQYDLDTITHGAGWSLLHYKVHQHDRTEELIEELREDERSRLTKVIKFLLDHGAKLDFQDRSGDTALHLAVKRDNYELTELLLKLGANPDIKNNDKKNTVKRAESKRVYKLLKKYGASGRRYFLN
ncbi:MAG: ankyrin repeat domain-containing protein [Bacteriovoracaceae bacterium]|nr:ankyrin repeat domain-containing protein [Bacteriovoracaceae bacterium]